MITDVTFQDLIDSANLLKQENKLDKSIEIYEEALHLASSNEQKNKVCNTLGKLYQNTRQVDKAIAIFNESLRLYDLLEDENSANKGIIYNNLGALHAETDQKSSIKNYKTALSIYSDLIATGQKEYSIHLANTKFALAEVFLKRNDFYWSKKYFKEAIMLYDEYKISDFDELKAGAYYQLGNIYTEEFNLYDAKVNYLKGLRLYEKLYDHNNLRFQPYVAAILNNLGVTLKSLDEHQKAIDYYQKALKHYDFLAEEVSDQFRPYVAATYNSLSILYAEIKDFENAIENSKKTTNIYHELVVQSPEIYTHYLATSLHNLGLYYFELLKVDLAEKQFVKALKIRKTLAEENPELFDADVCATSLNLLEVYQAIMEEGLDMAYKKTCLKLLEDVNARLGKYEQLSPVLQSMKSDLEYYKDYFKTINLETLSISKTLKKLDELGKEIDSTIVLDEKLKFQTQIVKLLETLQQSYKNSEKVKNELTYAYNDLAWLNLRSKKFKEAENIVLKAEVLSQPIMALKCNMAHAYLLQNKYEQAEALYLEISDAKNNNNEPSKIVIRRDFKKLVNDGIDPENFERIKKLLQL